ncbi:SCO family protein [Simplicispira psychrophila]|uniref:SCO family protein n=1 Tax=Simplicispira psychrophila TaxID=80882 RepID=UPI00048A1E51|nr:SCO family protein [Simplicispira psychrophila]
MLRTAFVSLLLAWAAYAAAAGLTHDFQVWTAEGARRLEVALQPVAVPPVVAEGTGISTQPLVQLLSVPSAITLVDFIYTRCQTVCLTLGSSFQQIQAHLLRDRAAGQGTGVRLLSISFDSTHDTPAALQAYAQQLQADPTVWRFARIPDAAQTQQLLRRFQVVVVPDGRGDYEHNAALLVLDGQGRLVRIFDLVEQQLALDYARHLARQTPMASVAGGSAL